MNEPTQIHEEIGASTPAKKSNKLDSCAVRGFLFIGTFLAAIIINFGVLVLLGKTNAWLYFAVCLFQPIFFPLGLLYLPEIIGLKNRPIDPNLFIAIYSMGTLLYAVVAIAGSSFKSRQVFKGFYIFFLILLLGNIVGWLYNNLTTEWPTMG